VGVDCIRNYCPQILCVQPLHFFTPKILVKLKWRHLIVGVEYMWDWDMKMGNLSTNSLYNLRNSRIIPYIKCLQEQMTPDCHCYRSFRFKQFCSNVDECVVQANDQCPHITHSIPLIHIVDVVIDDSIVYCNQYETHRWIHFYRLHCGVDIR